VSRARAAPPELNRKGVKAVPDTFEDSPLGALKPLQYEDVYRADDVPLHSIRHGVSRGITYFLLAAMGLFLFMGFNVRLSRFADYKFVLKGSEQQEYTYRYFDDIYLNEKYVAVGQQVTPGMPLLRISSPQIVSLINTYKASMQKEELLAKTGTPLYLSEMRAAELGRRRALRRQEDAAQQKQQVDKIYQNELLRHQFLIDEAARAYRVEQELFDAGVVSRQQLDAAREKLVLAEHNLNALKESNKREQLNIEIQMGEPSMDEAVTSNERAHKEEELRHQRALLKQDTALAYERLVGNYGSVKIEDGGLVILSTHSGKVSYLVNGDRDIRSGTAILKVTGGTEAIYASAVVPPGEIGLVKKDAPAILKVSTFPHYEWGTMQGRIRLLSTAPDDNGNYPLEVEVVDFGRLKDSLRVGMDGELSVEVEEKTFFGYIFEKVKKTYYSIAE